MTCHQCGTEVQGKTGVCPTCGTALKFVEEKSGGEQRKPKVPAKRWMVRATMILVLVGGIGVFLDQLLRTFHPVIERQPTVGMVTMYREQKIASVPIEATMKGGAIAIPLRAVQENKLVRFFDPEKIQEVPMIAYVTPQGKLVTAMSKSEHCGSTDFYLSGNNIHCASCPSYWNMASLEAYACCQKYYPDPFPSAVAGDEVRIDPITIRTWKSRL
ncbi:MAG: DUF2318 domain-containing protein [Ignavibacteriales bacterium]|nr:DUF2318 domain-containing protein [Ignavibacteriales bacterium]